MMLVWRHVNWPRGAALTQRGNLAELALSQALPSQAARHRAPQKAWLARAAEQLLKQES